MLYKYNIKSPTETDRLSCDKKMKSTFQIKNIVITDKFVKTIKTN